MATLDELLVKAQAQGASALLLKPGEPPTIRVHGAYQGMGAASLTGDDTYALCRQVVGPDRLAGLAREAGPYRTVYAPGTASGFAVSVLWREGAVHAAFLLMPGAMPSPRQLPDDRPGDAAVPALLTTGPPPRAGHDAKPMPKAPADIEPPREP